MTCHYNNKKYNENNSCLKYYQYKINYELLYYFFRYESNHYTVFILTSKIDALLVDLRLPLLAN